MPLLAVVVGAVTPARAGIAASPINAARMAGATLGVALLGAVLALSGGHAVGLRAAMATAAPCRLAARAWRGWR